MTTGTNQLTNSGAGSLVAPAGQIESQTDQLQKQVQENTVMLSTLEQRLRMVLRERPEPKPQAVNQAEPIKEYLVPHANRVRVIREEVEGHSLDLRSILERLEA